MEAFSYQLGTTPDSYECSKCAVAGCKLWRQYQTFADCIDLLCVDCALADQGETRKWLEVGEDGRYQPEYLPITTDTIRWLVPAVPTEDGYTFWGYTSVPQEGCVWWDELPLRGLKPVEWWDVLLFGVGLALLFLCMRLQV